MTPLRILRLVEKTFLVSVLLAMVALYFFNILARELGGTLASDFAWIEEAVRLLNLFMVFGALGLALERGRHVAIEILRDKLPARPKKLLIKIIDAVGFAFSVYMVVLGWELVVFVLQTGQRSPTLGIQMGWIYMAPVIGFALLALRYALSLFGVIDRFPAHGGESNPDAAEAVGG